jgi:hypothetical protein
VRASVSPANTESNTLSASAGSVAVERVLDDAWVPPAPDPCERVLEAATTCFRDKRALGAGLRPAARVAAVIKGNADARHAAESDGDAGAGLLE